MERIRAKVINKNNNNGEYFLMLEFLDHYNIHTGSDISEVRVSYDAYAKINVGDKILCPMLRESEGLIYDYNYPLSKI